MTSCLVVEYFNRKQLSWEPPSRLGSDIFSVITKRAFMRRSSGKKLAPSTRRSLRRMRRQLAAIAYEQRVTKHLPYHNLMNKEKSLLLHTYIL